MFVLTQLPTFPQLLNSSPGKAIRACAPKVLSEPDLSWSGSGSDRVWSWWLLGCLEDWRAKPSITQSLLGGLSGLALIIFFIIMRKYAYRRRGYRGHKPSYTVNRKFCRNLTWNKLANDADIYTAAVQLVYNPSVESSNQLGTILQLSTLKYSYKTLPNLLWLESGHERSGSWFISRWLDMCVCSRRYLLQTNPFLIMQLERITIRSMNLISLSLDMVPGLKDGRSIRLATS